MKKKFLIYVLTFVLILPCAMLLSGCFSDDKKNNQTETSQASTTTINFYYQNGNDLKRSINVDLSTTYYCEIGIENANFYETSGYYTEKDGKGIAVYDVVNNYTPAFKSFCEGKTVVNVYEYKVDKTYKLTLAYNGRTENRTCKVADDISLPEVNKYGYNFKGWSENPNEDFFTIKSIYAGKYTENVTLYAIFKPISFEIRYSTMPTNSGYCNESKRVTYDEIFKIEKPYTDGYLFHGFYTKPYGQGEQICDENCQFIIDFLPEDGMDSIYIYGYFTKAQTQQIIYDNINIDNTMTVRYRGYYANDVEKDYVVTYNEGDIIECIEPQKRTGHYFAGWYTPQDSKYNFEKSTENEKLLILKARFIKTDDSLFSNVINNAKTLNMENLAYGQSHAYPYVYDCEDGTVGFSAKFQIYTDDCSAMLSVTVNGSLAYSQEISNKETVSGSFNAKRGDKIVFSSYVTTNAPNGALKLSFSNDVETIANSVVVVERPDEFIMTVTEANNFEIEFAKIEGKTFMGYFTGENGTGEQITDATGKSLKPWVIKENNHYYKPYEDYITQENEYGLKLYAYYI